MRTSESRLLGPRPSKGARAMSLVSGLRRSGFLPCHCFGKLPKSVRSKFEDVSLGFLPMASSEKSPDLVKCPGVCCPGLLQGLWFSPSSETGVMATGLVTGVLCDRKRKDPASWV